MSYKPVDWDKLLQQRGPPYYDRNGTPMTLWEWAAKREGDESYRIVRQTTVGPYWISTVWLGLNHRILPFAGAPPLIFETMVFGAEPDDYADLDGERYSTEKEARSGHARFVREARRRVRELERLGRDLASRPAEP